MQDLNIPGRIKPSRSLKALKTTSKRIPKDLKTTIDQIIGTHGYAPSTGNLNVSDLRLFSIYGVPPSGNVIFQKAKAAAGLLTQTNK